MCIRDRDEVVLEKKEDPVGETAEGLVVKQEADVVKKQADVADVSKEIFFCRQCIESPCVWQQKKEDMVLFDESEHGHFQAEDCPPNNIRRKKVYRQMFLYINQGPAGKGVREKLPTCVENGARLMFPSPTFMGFRDM